MRFVTFHLNKLVRDKLPQQMIEVGQNPEVQKLEGADRVYAQIAKIAEEVAELDPKSPAFADELADVKQIVLDIETNVDQDVESIRLSKLDEKGGFSDGQYVTTLRLNTDDPWVEYYRKDPTKYTESPE